MPTFELLMQSTAAKADVFYRSFTTSPATADLFGRAVKRIPFTDSGHGIVASVRELAPGEKRKPKVTTLIGHVHSCMHPPGGRGKVKKKR
jgi:hypothetical protein